MTDVFTTICFEYNGEVTSVTTIADGSGGWPQIISAAENSARNAVNEIEAKMMEENLGRTATGRHGTGPVVSRERAVTHEP
jgi:hypothetical protein